MSQNSKQVQKKLLNNNWWGTKNPLPLQKKSYMENLLPQDGKLYHFPNYYTQKQSESFMQILTDKVKWQQDKIKMYGKEHNIPRLTSWYGTGGLSYSYSGINMLPNKIDFEELSLIHSGIGLEVWNMGLIDDLNHFNSVLLNQYRDGKDSVSWHADDEKELGINPIIASITFGATRTFKFRHKLLHSMQKEIELTPGSLVIMAGATQHHWEHSIPKTTKEIGPRINLTFRNIR
jgi:alkylated DNA repair dioxygenase AlkB